MTQVPTTPPHLREVSNWIIDIGLLIIELLDSTLYLQGSLNASVDLLQQYTKINAYVLTNVDHSMGVYIPFSLSEDSDP